MIEINLRDRVTIVIGGTRGIGASVVRLASEAQSRVAWTGPPLEKDIAASSELMGEMHAAGRTVMNAVVDATDEAATHDFVSKVASEWGGIHGLVYCPGFTNPTGLLDITADEWRKVVDINLTGAFIAVHAAIPHMLQAGGGSIVFIGSAAVTSGGGGRADYVSAKAGLDALNKAITREFAPQGIRCNVVHPALIATDLLVQRYPDEAQRQKVAEGVPLRRLGRPEDVANMVVFLLSDLASYVAAQSILVDGGRSYCA
ncbi:MAG: SDR family NAD(P)-dependent oxidoreductase [Armatimonadota bacterium]